MKYFRLFGQNLAIGSEDRAHKRLFHSYMILVTLKLRSCSQKSGHSFWMSQISIYPFRGSQVNGQTKSYIYADDNAYS